jgi:ribosomal protein S25
MAALPAAPRQEPQEAGVVREDILEQAAKAVQAESPLLRVHLVAQEPAVVVEVAAAVLEILNMVPVAAEVFRFLAAVVVDRADVAD